MAPRCRCAPRSPRSRGPPGIRGCPRRWRDRGGGGGVGGGGRGEAGRGGGFEFGAALAPDDLSARDRLAGECLDSEPLRVGVAAVAAGAEPLLMSHRRSPCSLLFSVWRGLF